MILTKLLLTHCLHAKRGRWRLSQSQSHTAAAHAQGGTSTLLEYVSQTLNSQRKMLPTTRSRSLYAPTPSSSTSTSSSRGASSHALARSTSERCLLAAGDCALGVLAIER